MADTGMIHGPVVQLPETNDLYIRKALTELSIASGEYLSHWQPQFNCPTGGSVPVGWAVGLAGSGAATDNVTNGKGGVFQLSSGATGSSSAELTQRSAIIGRVAVDKWYTAVRLQVTTAIDNQARVAFWHTNAAVNKTVGAGVFGALNSTNYVVQYDGDRTGSVIDLAVAVDTSWHVIEFWAAGSTTLKARIDGGTTLTATMSSAPSDAMLFRTFHAGNGTTAAARTLNIDWVLNVAQRMS